MKNYMMAGVYFLSLSTNYCLANNDEVQDMSDPLAVYTQAGAGITNNGLNLKVGQAYDTGSDTSMAMNIFEVKGFFGETLGWDDQPITDNSIDAVRYRNFKLDLTNGRGTQIDLNYNFDASAMAEQSGDISYAMMQALPKFGALNIYPLAGAGISFGNNVLEDDGTIDSGYSAYGTFALIGMYGKLALTEKVWLNYNPFYLSTLSGSGVYKNHAFGLNNSNILLHEFALNYQINPRMNVRYFANWSEYTDFSDGNHRIEVNYQL